MVAQTVPSKIERARLEIDVADMAGCEASVAASVIDLVLATYAVTPTPRKRRKPRMEPPEIDVDEADLLGVALPPESRKAARKPRSRA